jgi:uncharacterized protein YecE (DUF72 family)
MKKLHDPEEPMERFITAIAPIKKLLGPILIQLPPSLKFDRALVEYYYKLLKTQYSEFDFALEPRHATWMEDESIALMERYKIAFVISESGGRFPYGEYVTAKNIYVRFHGPEKLYDSSYSNEALKKYAEKFEAWMGLGHTIWVFFNNTMHYHALENTSTLKKLLGIE